MAMTGKRAATKKFVFVSCADKDSEKALEICHILEKYNIQYWIAPRGSLFDIHDDKIINTMNRSEAFIFLLSKNSKKSSRQKLESHLAINLKKKIFPVRIEKVKIDNDFKIQFGHTQWMDAFKPPLEDRLQNLIASLRQWLSDTHHQDATPEHSRPDREAMTGPVPGAKTGRKFKGRPLPLGGTSSNTSRETKSKNTPEESTEPSAEKRFPQPDGLAIPTIKKDKMSNTINADSVIASVFCPHWLQKGHCMLVQVFLHDYPQFDKVHMLAKDFDDEAEKKGFTTLCQMIKHGSSVQIELHIPSLNVVDPVQEIIWNGYPESVQFEVNASATIKLKSVIGTVMLSVDSVPIGHIKLKIKISDAESLRPAQYIGQEAKHYTNVFTSYASPDRLEVLKRVQALRAAGLMVFQDILSLEPGDRWEQKLYKHIDECDLFLLYWSQAAKDSKWVIKEALYALNCKGGEIENPPEIKPVILEGPPIPKPPKKLSCLHFNDSLAYILNHPSVKNSK
jgi:hypothetical protein